MIIVILFIGLVIMVNLQDSDYYVIVFIRELMIIMTAMGLS